MEVKQWEIYMCDLGNSGRGSEQNYKRPVVIVQNDIGNKFSPTTIVAVITAEIKKNIPTHMDINLLTKSTVLFEQLKTIDKSRLLYKMGELNEMEIEQARERLLISLGL